MKASILFLFSLVVLFSSCRKEPLIAPSAPQQQTQNHSQNQPEPQYKGEKVIFYRWHESCEGAILFKRMDGSYLRAISYPKEVAKLQPGDTLYIQYELAKLQNNTGIEFGTKPIEITSVSIPRKQEAPNSYPSYR